MHTRRETLIAGSAAIGSLIAGPGFSLAAECLLTSRQIDGPYHIEDVEDRRDVRSGRPGVDLVLRIKVVDANTCEVIPGARTEIWSCDALGNYSGHPDVDPNVPPGGGRGPGSSGGRIGEGRGSGGQAGGPSGLRRGLGAGPPRDLGGRPGGHREPTGPLRYLRGSQLANDEGEVEFLTIYPGWYNPRAVHVHVKVHVEENEFLTTQLYFPDDLTDTIHRTEPYVQRHPTPFTNSNDRVMRVGLNEGDPVGVFPTMTANGETQIGTITIGARRA